ncbi:hypothetical protein AVEN_17348-1 [Araneus ventricosus]|uniref:Uncharacterized protein n=1 Tax=Araneus ventricosus TaxID=182803 RepID=A0A4Y2VMY7_ARAVE|nr:hypothetical protein AVEN_17348-1 [Araneus ventricosus]
MKISQDVPPKNMMKKLLNATALLNQLLTLLAPKQSDGGKSSHSLMKNASVRDAPVLENMMKNLIECQILPAEPVVNAFGARNKADEKDVHILVDENVLCKMHQFL